MAKFYVTNRNITLKFYIHYRLFGEVATVQYSLFIQLAHELTPARSLA